LTLKNKSIHGIASIVRKLWTNEHENKQKYVWEWPVSSRSRDIQTLGMIFKAQSKEVK